MNCGGGVIGTMRMIGFLAGFGVAVCLPLSAMAQEPAIPANLSVGGMFMAADWIDKLVMIGLLFASFVTWTVFIAKVLELRKATAAERAVHDAVIDQAMRKMGRYKWKAAQRLVYPCLLLSLAHWLLLDWKWQPAAVHLAPLICAWLALLVVRRRNPVPERNSAS